MSCFDVQILDPNINIIEIQTCIGDQPTSIDVLTYDNTSIIEVNHCVALLPSEINDLITVKDILAGSGINVSDSSGIYTVSLSDPTIYSSGIVDLVEAVQDIIGNSGLVAGNHININYDDYTGYTTVSTTGLQPSGNYSIIGHTHNTNDITNFNSGVSGLLPVKNISAGSGIGIISNSGDFIVSVTGSFGLTGEQVDDRVGDLLKAGNYITLNYNDLGDSLTVAVTGLQPSGNYANAIHTHAIGDVTGLQTSLDSKAAVSHTHTVLQITDFNTGVSGLLPVKNVLGSGYVGVNSVNGAYTVSVTGLQPSGNYSINGHTHTISNIIDITSAGSGIITALSYADQNKLGWERIFTTLDAKAGGQYFVPTSNIIPAAALTVNDPIAASLGDFYQIIKYPSSASITVGGIYYDKPIIIYRIYQQTNVGFPIQNLVSSWVSYTLNNFHEHTASDITNFNSAVSGLLPPPNFTSLTGLSGIAVTNSGTNYFVALSDPTIQLTDITDLSSNARTFLLTPSSSNLNTLISDETGSGNLVFNTSPSFSGTPTVPTAPSGTNSTQIASTAFVRTEISNLVDSSPSTLDTLNELAAALGDDPNFATTIASGLGQKANLSGAIFTGPVTIPSGTGNFNNLSVNNIPVSVSGHIHSYTDITNFASGVEAEVSTLLVAGNYVNINYDNLADTLTISATGLQPSGNYANSVHSHGNITNSGAIGSTSGLLVVTDTDGLLTTSSGITSSYITNFNSTVSGLLPIINNSGDNRLLTNNGTATGIDAESNLTFDGNNTTPTLSISGLVPTLELKGAGSVIFLNENLSNIIDSSGGEVTIIGSSGLTISGGINNLNINNSGLYYNNTPISISGHTHSSSDITNFNTGVSGLLPSVSGSGYVNSFFNNNIYTISVSGLQPSGNYSVVGHTHTASNITDFNSSVSGLLPTISNTLNNRLLTSIGTPVGINAETNLTFDGTTFSVGASPATIIAQSGITTAQINVDSLRLDNNVLSTTTADSDLILFPNGNGSLLADPSGNLRGIYSNDFQRERTSVSGVAAGSYNVICGGSDNRTANSYSVVCGGQTNVASNSWSMVGGGDLNNATGNRSVICGGGSNSSSAQSSTVGGGSNNQATGVYSIIPGGFRAKASRHGELSHSAGFFNAAGDAQHTILIARRLTTDATADVVLTLNGLAPVLTNVLTIPAQTMWTFSIKLSAYNVTNNEAAWWIFRGGIKRNNANSTVLIGSLITENGAESTLSTASAAVVADDTNEALEIRVTGVTGKNIRWVAVVDISQVSFGTP